MTKGPEQQAGAVENAVNLRLDVGERFMLQDGQIGALLPLFQSEKNY